MIHIDEFFHCLAGIIDDTPFLKLDPTLATYTRAIPMILGINVGWQRPDHYFNLPTSSSAIMLSGI